MDGREINIGASDMIEIVGKGFPRDDRDDLRNLGIAVTCTSSPIEVFVVDPASVFNKFSSKMKRGVDLTVG